MNPSTETTESHVFRLLNDHLTITQHADPGSEEQPFNPAQTVWLNPQEVRKLIEFLQNQTETK